MATEHATRAKELEPGVWEYTDKSVRYYNHPNHRSGAILRKSGSMAGRAITPATAPALLMRRHELWQQAAAEGAMAGTKRPTVAAAWAAVVEARARVAVDDGGTPGNQAAEIVGRALGAYGQQAEHQQPPALELRLSGAAVEQLAQLLQQRQAAAGRMVDAEAIELT